jgi:hypothetical protein
MGGLDKLERLQDGGEGRRGWRVGHRAKRTLSCGPVDPQAIKRFQSEHTDWTGRPLHVDGQLGPRTRWALAIADLPRHRREIVHIACSQVGVEEVPAGSNRGVAIDGYLRPTGLSAVPWCAAFVSWVLREAGCLIDGLKYTPSAAQCIRQLRPAVGDSLPLPGDVFGWVNPDGTGHVGFVIGVPPPFPINAIITCEGNSRHGVRVNRRPRAGLSFGVAPQPLVLVSAVVPEAPLVLRVVEGTR